LRERPVFSVSKSLRTLENRVRGVTTGAVFYPSPFFYHSRKFSLVLKNFLSLKGRGKTTKKLKKSVSELLDL